MNHPRQIAPRTSPGGQTPVAMPTSPGNISPWPLADGVDDRRVPPYEAPSTHAPKKRGRPSRADRKTAAPPRLAAIAPKPPQPAPGPNTPRPILPATQRQVDAQNSQQPPPVHALPPLDSPPGRKKRRTAAGAVSVSTPPSLPPPPPYLPPVTTPPSSMDHGNRPVSRKLQELHVFCLTQSPQRSPGETDSTNVRETTQIQPPRPMPLEPEPRRQPLMPVASAAPPSQIKA